MRTKWSCHRWHQQLTLFWTFSTYQTATIHTCLTVITPTLQMRKVSLREFKWLSKSLGLVSAAHSRKPDSLWLKHTEAYFSCISILDVRGFGDCFRDLTTSASASSFLNHGCSNASDNICIQEKEENGVGLLASLSFLSGKQKLF